MRIIVKGADFSAVSIGKVEKDHSFSYTGSTLRALILNAANPSAALPWGSQYDSYVAGTTYYNASSESAEYTESTNKYRGITDYIEVDEGMVITSNLVNTETIPIIICFDANKNILGPSSTYTVWNTVNGSSITYTIPQGVKYIRLQTNSIVDETIVSGAVGN